MYVCMHTYISIYVHMHIYIYTYHTYIYIYSDFIKDFRLFGVSKKEVIGSRRARCVDVPMFEAAVDRFDEEIWVFPKMRGTLFLPQIK